MLHRLVFVLILFFRIKTPESQHVNMSMSRQGTEFQVVTKYTSLVAVCSESSDLDSCLSLQQFTQLKYGLFTLGNYVATYHERSKPLFLGIVTVLPKLRQLRWISLGQLPADASQFVLGIEDLPTSAVSANRQLPQRPFGGSRGAMMCGFGMGQNVDIFMDPQEIINDV